MRSTATPPSHKICFRLFPSSYTGRVGDALGRWPVHRFRLNRPCHHDHIVQGGCLRWKNPGPGYALRSPKRGVDGTDWQSWTTEVGEYGHPASASVTNPRNREINHGELASGSATGIRSCFLQRGTAHLYDKHEHSDNVMGSEPRRMGTDELKGGCSSTGNS